MTRCRHLRLGLLLFLAGWVATQAFADPPAPAAACGDCDDGNPCTTDSCDQSSGACLHVPVADFEPCDDASACTQDDICYGGVCHFISQLPEGDPCDDSDPCTGTGVCDAAGACVVSPLQENAPCDDGDPCTTGTVCVPGPEGALVCRGEPFVCDDQDPCTDQTCDPATGLCVTSPVACDDGNPCTSDVCGLQGECLHTIVTGTVCDDGDHCTSGERCQADGRCGGAPITCDDSLACTIDSCDPARGCVFTENCDDGNNCNEDHCGTSGCFHTAGKLGLPCAPSNLCIDAGFSHWVCIDNQLVCSGPPRDCRFDSRCYTYGCNPAIGCVATPVTCDDGNPCTFDGVCEFMTGCPPSQYQPGPCDDGNSCTTGDVCVSDPGGAMATCRGTAANCDDGDPCTIDDCAPTGGACLHTPRDCADADPCTVDSCDSAGGGCQHPPADCDDHDACTADSCNSITGACVNTPGNCDDANPCTVDTCQGGQCVFVPADCDDHDACTADFCSPAEGFCDHVPVGCDDADVCTRDICDPATGCRHDPALDCDDGNPCTLDRCDAVSGCASVTDPSLPDGDADGIADACDVCPSVPNPGQNPDDCRQAIEGILVSFDGGQPGHGQAVLSWRTTHEVTLGGFNLVSIDARGRRTALNAALIPCTACVNGLGASYVTLVPKHKSGKGFYVEMVGADGVPLGIFGPAQRR